MVCMLKGRHHINLNTQVHDWPEAVPCSLLLIDHNTTTAVRTGGGFMASEIFTPDVLYSSVIHSFEYHSAIHF